MECQICYEHFDSNSFTPKILIKCGHSFCKICSERIAAKSPNINCPVCREVTKLTKNKDLPTNYALMEIIEKLKESNLTKNILEKYKFFNDKNYRNIAEKIIRTNDPKILNLKKIENEDFIYLEEISKNQTYSIFSTAPRRNNRYNFNRNSLFAYFFNEFSSSLMPFRKASKCAHSFSCLEHLLRNVFKYSCIALLLKFPLRYLVSCFSNNGNASEAAADVVSNCNSNNSCRFKFYVKLVQFAFLGLASLKEVYKCFRNFQIDEFIKK